MKPIKPPPVPPKAPISPNRPIPIKNNPTPPPLPERKIKLPSNSEKPTPYKTAESGAEHKIQHDSPGSPFVIDGDLVASSTVNLGVSMAGVAPSFAELVRLYFKTFLA